MRAATSSVKLLIFIGLLPSSKMVMPINTPHESGLGVGLLLEKLQEYL